MSGKTWIVTAMVSIWLATMSLAQGFAGLGETAAGFLDPQPGHGLRFPADRGPHPGFRIEWWYLTANMTGADGRDYGLQWTLFRNALRPETGTPLTGWSSPQVWLGHAALTTPESHFVAERLARGGIGQAGVAADPFAAWIDDWQMIETGTGYALTARGDEFAYAVELVSGGPRILHGDAGYSVKSAGGQASYYYSEPFLTLTGTLTLPSGDVAVTGQAWLDREWSSRPLAADQTGWDWFSLSFETGDRLMGFRLRGADEPFTSATWIAADGSSESYGDGAFGAAPSAVTIVEGYEVPTSWHVSLPEKGVAVDVVAVNPNAWMDVGIPYWEGPVRVSGSHLGRGYLEMTGYDQMR